MNTINSHPKLLHNRMVKIAFLFYGKEGNFPLFDPSRVGNSLETFCYKRMTLPDHDFLV